MRISNDKNLTKGSVPERAWGERTHFPLNVSKEYVYRALHKSIEAKHFSISAVSDEKSYSTLHFVKNRMHSSMAEHRFKALMLLYEQTDVFLTIVHKLP